MPTAHPAAPARFTEFAAMSQAERADALATDQAPAWIEAAARHGLVQAQVLLGQLHLEGRARPTFPGLAFRWFSAAAEAGYPPALNMLGRCLEHGWDTAPDKPAAVASYRRAAEAALDWGQFNLANALLYGIGTARDRPAAYGWYERAADQGHAKSMNMLGRFHEEGWDRPACRVAAARWYRDSAEAGDFRGQFNLASMLHRQGRVEEAVRWLRLAVAAGSPDFLADADPLLSGNDDPRVSAVGREARRRFQTCE